MPIALSGLLVVNKQLRVEFEEALYNHIGYFVPCRPCETRWTGPSNFLAIISSH